MTLKQAAAKITKATDLRDLHDALIMFDRR